MITCTLFLALIMADLKVCSSNVRGMRQTAKRRQQFSYFHRYNFDLILVQETHCTPDMERVWQNEWGGHIIFSHGTSSSKGVAILFNPKLHFSIVKVRNDQNGRYIILDLSIGATTLTVICCYGPNRDDPLFYNSISQVLHSFNCSSIIWGGDFNFVFNLSIDKQGGDPRTNFKARDECLLTMAEFNLIDAWRELNPLGKAFTWHSNIANIHCRLDFFSLVSPFVG